MQNPYGPSARRRNGQAAYPETNRRGAVTRDHRRMMEAWLGRKLRSGEEVHHIDGDAYNNHPDNLLLCDSHAEHMRLHTNTAVCLVEGCPKSGRRILGLCENHYRVWHRRGTTDTLIKHRGRWER